MARVEFDPRHAQRVIEAELLRRLEAAGEVSVARARQLCPHDSGRLARSIAYVIDRGRFLLRFGTELLYGRFVEIGTARMPPRSFIRRAALELWEKYKQIFGAR